MVHEVLVQAEELAGVGDVFGLGFGFDVPRPAVEGVLDRADALGDALDFLFVLGYVGDENQARLAQVGEGAPELGFIRHPVVVADAVAALGQPRLEHRLVPRDVGVRLPELAAHSAGVLEPRLDLVGWEHGRVRLVGGQAVVGEDDLEGAVGEEGGAVDDRVAGQLGSRKVLLARVGVDAARAWAGVPQPERVETNGRSLLGVECDIGASRGDGNPSVLFDLCLEGWGRVGREGSVVANGRAGTGEPGPIA